MPVFAQIVPSVPLREQPDGKNQLNSQYTKKSAVYGLQSSWIVIDFMLTGTIHTDLSVRHRPDESNEKGYNMRTNRLFSTNGSTNALNLIYYHQQ